MIFHVKLVHFFLFPVDGAYASNSQSDPDFRQAVGPTAHHYPGLFMAHQYTYQCILICYFPQLSFCFLVSSKFILNSMYQVSIKIIGSN